MNDRQRLLDALMAEKKETSRGYYVPLAEYSDGSFEFAWPQGLVDLGNALTGGMTSDPSQFNHGDPSVREAYDEQIIGNAVATSGAMSVGSLAAPRPANALGAFGAHAPQPSRQSRMDALRQRGVELDQKYKHAFEQAIEALKRDPGQDYSKAMSGPKAVRGEIAKNKLDIRTEAASLGQRNGRDILESGGRVVFHGTNSPVDQFDISRAKERNMMAAFVTPKYDFAEGFAGGDGKVHVLGLRDGRFWSPENEADVGVLGEFARTLPDGDRWLDEVSGGAKSGGFGDTWAWAETTPGLQDFMVSKGYDGMWLNDNLHTSGSTPTLAVWSRGKLKDLESGKEFYSAGVPMVGPYGWEEE